MANIRYSELDLGFDSDSKSITTVVNKGNKTIDAKPSFIVAITQIKPKEIEG